MANYQLTNKAKIDLKNIWNYTIEKWSENQADKYVKELLQCFDEIGQGRIFGKNYNRIAKNLKGIRTNKHIVFYRDNEVEKTEITRILHERMDVETRFREE